MVTCPARVWVLIIYICVLGDENISMSVVIMLSVGVDYVDGAYVEGWVCSGLK